MRVLHASGSDAAKPDSARLETPSDDVVGIDSVRPQPAAIAQKSDANGRTKGASRLRRMLMTSDGIALLVGWVATSLVTWELANLNRPVSHWLLVMVLGIGLSLAVMRSRGLHLSRVTTIRAVEASKVCTSLLISTLGTYLLLSPFDLQRTVTGYEIIYIFIVSSFLVVVGRGFYRNWLTRRRAEGLFAREVMVVGTNQEAKELIDLLENNPGLGYKVSGVLGYPGQAAFVGIDVDRLLVGSIEKAEHHIAEQHAAGVIVVDSALADTERGDVVHRLLHTGAHVQITGGVRGVDQRRVHAQPLADSAIMYLEPAKLHRWQLAFKRTLDVVVSGTILALASPLILLSAIAVKAYDRGPSFERLDRLDQSGRTYSVWTLRTTVAKRKLAKMDEDAMFRPRSLWNDPYRTPIGRVLEATSLNELPQLLSVLTGTTSLVGHRPTWIGDPNAQPDSKHPLPPGLTGLWRVETRYSSGHNEFLDDYYVENWTVSLDLVILLATLDKALMRLVHGESWRREADVEQLPLLTDMAPASSEISSLAS